MRPRRLTLTALGPYAETVDLDFDRLAGAGVFLIHGPTGAGKTFLLDALCYALYGAVPGLRRQDDLRSHHADLTVTTRVALEFALAGYDWRVTRVPPHERAKKLGTGTTRQKPKATLSRREGEVWVPVVDGADEVRTEVEQLLGLDPAQFQQVVLLPQGRVQAALIAEGAERERLLTSLFGADRFAAYTAALEARACAAERVVAEVATDVAAIGVRAADRAADVDRVSGTASATPALGVEDAAAPMEVGDAAEQVQEWCDHATEAVAVLAEAVTAAAEARASADEHRRDIEAAHARWQRRREALAAAGRLDALEEDVAGWARALERARRAAPAGPLRTARDEARTARRDANAALDRARRRLSVDVRLPHDAASAADLAAALAAGGTVDRAATRTAIDELTACATRVEGLRADADAASKHTALAAEREEDAKALRSRAADLRLQATGTQEAAQELTEDVATARGAAMRLPAERLAVADLSSAVGAAGELGALREAHTSALADALRAHQDADAAEQQLLELYAERLDGMAAELAGRLRPGDPCAVCGAREHPNPAASATSVSDVDLARATADRDADRRTAQTLDAAAAEAEAALAAAVARAGAHAEDPSAGAELLSSARAELLRFEELAGSLPGLIARRDDLLQQGAALAEAATAAAEEAAAAGSAAAGHRVRASEHAAALADALPDGVGLAEASAALAMLRSALTAVADAAAEVDQADRDLAELDRRLADLAADQGFGDVEELEQAVLAQHACAELEQRLRAHDAERARVDAVLAETDDDPVATATAPPDLKAAVAAATAADATHADVLRRAATAEAAAADLASCADAVGRLARRHAELVVQARRLRRLADVCDGRGNALRMSLKRYVLAAFLEDITACASQRLSVMSSGRYTLRHTDRRARHGAGSGLGIVVGDAHTGVDREVGTLSGGETFTAALALALGIADTVQRTSGGVHLDALFVDEGFGSLDADALEQAMGELDRLREGGRMVGIISHVPLLLERVGVGVQVRRTERGSTASIRAAPVC